MATDEPKTHKPISLKSLVIPGAYVSAEITSHAFTVLIKLCAHAKFSGEQAGQCWPSIPRLCALSGLSKCTVRKCLGELEKKKFIVVEEKGNGRRSTVYLLPAVAAMAAEAAEAAKASKQVDDDDVKQKPSVKRPVAVSKIHATQIADVITINNKQHKTCELINKLVAESVRIGKCRNENALRASLVTRAGRGIVYKNTVVSGGGAVSECLDVTAAVQVHKIGTTRRMRAGLQ